MNEIQEKMKDKTIFVIVNGVRKELPKDKKKLAYEEIVEMAFGSFEDNDNNVYTVTYVKGEGNHEGTLLKGESVTLKKEMIFNVTLDHRS